MTVRAGSRAQLEVAESREVIASGLGLSKCGCGGRDGESREVAVVQDGFEFRRFHFGGINRNLLGDQLGQVGQTGPGLGPIVRQLEGTFRGGLEVSSASNSVEDRRRSTRSNNASVSMASRSSMTTSGTSMEASYAGKARPRGLVFQCFRIAMVSMASEARAASSMTFAGNVNQSTATRSGRR